MCKQSVYRVVPCASTRSVDTPPYPFKSNMIFPFVTVYEFSRIRFNLYYFARFSPIMASAVPI